MTVFIVCYDISVDARRARVARLLEKYGERVQKSVFRLEVRPAAMEHLKARLLAIMECDDELLVVPLCGQCYAASLRAGPPVPLLCVA